MNKPIKRVQNKEVREFILECGICGKVMKGKSDIDVDKQYNAHYFFNHEGVD